MSLVGQINALATRAAQEIKAVRAELAASSEVEATHAIEPLNPNVDLWIDLDDTAPAPLGWLRVTQAQYDALSPPDPDVLYVVIGA